MRRITFLTLLTIFVLTLFPAPKAQAIDPVTIAILAPIALELAEIAQPYVTRGLISGGQQMLVMGSDMLEMFLIPLGLLQGTLLAPWQFSSGIKNFFVGCIAPFKLVFHTLLLPIAFLGIGVN